MHLAFGAGSVISGDVDDGLRDAAPPPLLVVLAASGAGKSSFPRAGLLPRLARDDQHFLPLPVIPPERAALYGETGLLRALEAACKSGKIATSRADLRAAIQGGSAKAARKRSLWIERPAQLEDNNPITYRCEPNVKDAQLLQNELHRHFNKSAIFLDVSGVDGGENWPLTLEHQVDASAVMICLIGKGWAEIEHSQGSRRLDNPRDVARVEIVRALLRKIPVYAVLIDGATMPDISQLPRELMELTNKQAMSFSSLSKTKDADEIARCIKSLVGNERPACTSAG